MSALTTPRLGVLGGLGPLASADFYRKVIELTPADRDADHIAMVVLSVPQVPDRSKAVLAGTDAPLSALKDAVSTLNACGVELISIACNTAHHWYEPLAAHSRAPIVHVADGVLAELAEAGSALRVLLMATRGTLQSGFYQRSLAAAGHDVATALDIGAQDWIDDAIRLVKCGDLAGAEAAMQAAFAACRTAGFQAVILACTELPIAAAAVPADGLIVIDPSLAMARTCLRRLGVAV